MLVVLLPAALVYGGAVAWLVSQETRLVFQAGFPLGVEIRRNSAEGDMRVRRFLKGDTLVEHMAIDKGSRINVYHVRGDHVRVDSTIKSTRLASPIKFSYTYR